MIVFVSYARRDHELDALQGIQAAVTSLGAAYVDDVHGHGAADRRAAVEAALHAAAVFVGVLSPHYLRTPWTWREFAYSLHRGIPIIALLPDGRLVDHTEVDWPWRREAAIAGGLGAVLETPVQASRQDGSSSGRVRHTARESAESSTRVPENLPASRELGTSRRDTSTRTEPGSTG